jgi:hypothetical protein
MMVPLTLIGDSGDGAFVQYATQDGTAVAGTDYIATTGSIVFPVGATSASIPVQIRGSTTNGDYSKNFSLQLLGSGGGSLVPSFVKNATFATGTQPNAAAAGDLNGDGLQDLVVANGPDSTISVLRNTTSPGASVPTFDTQQTISIPSPVALAIRDLNGDGKPDVIVTSTGGNSIVGTVTVLLNTTPAGSHTFSFTTGTFNVSYQPTYSDVADLNGDGRPDIITANSGTKTISVLLNTTTPGSTTPSFASKGAVFSRAKS